MKPSLGSLTVFLSLPHLWLSACVENYFSEELKKAGSESNTVIEFDADSSLSFVEEHEHTEQRSPKLRQLPGDEKTNRPLGHIVGISPSSRKYWDPDNNWYFEVNDVTGYLHGSKRLGTFSDSNCKQEIFESEIEVENCIADRFSDRRPVFAQQGDPSGWTKGVQAVTLGAITLVNERYLKDENGVCHSTHEQESFCVRTLEAVPDFPTAFAMQANQ